MKYICSIINKLSKNNVGITLARGSGSAFVVNIAGRALVFFMQAILARIMGVTHYGIYIYVLTWVNILVLLSKFGQDILLLRYISKYKALQNWGFLKGILEFSNKIVLIYSLTIGGLVIFILVINKEKLGVDLFWTFSVSTLILPLASLTGLRQAVLQSLKHVFLAKLPDAVIHPIFISTVIGLVYLFSIFQITSFRAMAINIASYSFVFIIGTYLLYKKIPVSVQSVNPSYNKKEWMNAAYSLFFISGMNMILSNTDTVMIGIMLNTTEAGIYAIISNISTLVLFGAFAINTILAPMISEYYTTSNHEKLQQIVAITALGILLSSLPVVVIIFLFGKLLLSIFGSAFISGYISLLILTLGHLINASVGSVGFLMTMTGHQKKSAYVMGGSALLNILLNFMLIPKFQIQGAAIATALTTALWNIILLIYVKRILGINSSILSILQLIRNLR